MAGIPELIDRQVRKWEVGRQAAQGQKDTLDRQHPTVTVSSEFGSRGAQVSRVVAERLQYDLFDRELIDEVAAVAQVRRRVVESLDDRVRDAISEHIVVLFGERGFSGGDFLHCLSSVVLTIGHHGRAVIVGRGAQFMLEPRTTVRVRTMAAGARRIRNIMEDSGLAERDARLAMERVDTERRAFARRHFSRDLTDPCHYDLLLSTDALSVAQVAEIVVAAVKIRFG